MASNDGLQPPKERGWIDDLVHELRVKNPPSAGGWLKYQNIVATIMAAAFTFLGAAYWRSVDEISLLRKTANEARSEVEQIQKERTARIAEIDQWRSNVETELRTYRIAFSEFQQMKGVVDQIGKKLSDGRDERLRDRETDRSAQQRDRDMIMGAISDLKTQVALLGQSRGAPGRNPDPSPFGGENQMWTPPLIDPTLEPPPILKATLSEPQARSSRVAVRRGGKRRGVMLVGLTRSLERTFGRPHWKRRTWP